MKVVAFDFKSLFWASSLSLAVWLYPLPSLALTVQEVPNPRQNYGGWVTDMADILKPNTENQLNQIIDQLKAKNGAEIAVVTVPETAPAASPKEFTTELFNYWKIGKKGQDNGVLFLISVKDRRVEIETGYGVEGILPDAKVGNIIDTQILPRFKQKDFDGGALAGTRALIVILESERLSSQGKAATQDISIIWKLLAASSGLVLVIGAGTYAYVKRHRRVSIEPEGQSHIEKSASSRTLFYCTNCQTEMERVNEAILQAELGQPQLVAQQLGSVRFEGWQCPNCRQQLGEQKFHILAYNLHPGSFLQCPHCHELTVTRTEQIVKPATKSRHGKCHILNQCHCCSYRKEKTEKIPCLVPPSPGTRISRNTWSSSGFGGSGSFGGGSSGGGSSGGGSSGGGSSGGGGAGGSW